MLELLVVVGALGLADSINPSTVIPALYLATQPHARVHLTGFIVGVFVVSSVAGLVAVLGPGQLLLDIVPHPARHTRYTLEVAGGLILLIAAVVLWRLRHRSIGSEPAPGGKASGRSSLLLGGSIMAIELPTALPYFAALAVIIGSGRGLASQVILVAAYNVLFVLPLLLIVGAHILAPRRTERALGPVGAWLRTNALAALAVLAAIAGVVLLTLGVRGLAL
jgi:cytochrome c biogenesis protein CcdA